MPRQARIDYEGAYHHIMSRGFKREQLFDDKEDYLYYIDCINEFKHYGYRILEYCLMPNHTHILLKTGEIRLQKILKSINTRYAIYKSRKRGLPGPIFQGRPKSILITDEKHLLVVARYILRNPVKAGLCRNLYHYPWSSYKLITKMKVPKWYDNGIILKEFSSKSKIQSLRRYKEYIRKPLKSDDKEYPLELFSGIAAGTKTIYEGILKKTGRDKRKNKSDGNRKLQGNEIITKLLEKNNLKLSEIYNSQKREIIKIRQKLSYILKDICHWESSTIQSKLHISAPTLCRYVNELRCKVRNKRFNVNSLIE